MFFPLFLKLWGPPKGGGGLTPKTPSSLLPGSAPGTCSLVRLVKAYWIIGGVLERCWRREKRIVGMCVNKGTWICRDCLKRSGGKNLLIVKKCNDAPGFTLLPVTHQS